MGGEKSTSMPQTWRPTGSPPRGRGKVDVVGVRPAYDRITPAWAGKSGSIHGFGSLTQDHPRMGGEKRALCRAESTVMGSPPRGRGKGLLAVEAGDTVGITPAWAGKRSSRSTLTASPTDHPRVGGEKAHCQGMLFRLSGSPPRGRGKGVVEGGHVEVNRITPA